jgi:hypothetical protein
MQPVNQGLLVHFDNGPSPATLPQATPGGPEHRFPGGLNLFHDFNSPDSCLRATDPYSLFSSLTSSSVEACSFHRCCAFVYSFPTSKSLKLVLCLPLVYQACHSFRRFLRHPNILQLRWFRLFLVEA